MKVSLTLENFPMGSLADFKRDLDRYVKATVQPGGEDTVFVTFSTYDIALASCGLIVCDKYQFNVSRR